MCSDHWINTRTPCWSIIMVVEGNEHTGLLRFARF
jgi:hypothetical protein